MLSNTVPRHILFKSEASGMRRITISQNGEAVDDDYLTHSLGTDIHGLHVNFRLTRTISKTELVRKKHSSGQQAQPQNSETRIPLKS